MSRDKVLAAIGVGLAVLVGLVVVLVLVFRGGDPESVEEVADAAIAAAEDLDVDRGIDLLCDAPSADERADVEDLIAEAQDEAGTENPAVDYDISDVEGERSGRFTVTVSSDEEELADRGFSLVVLVEVEDGRSCIAGVEDVD
jgi:hypothetical protein